MDTQSHPQLKAKPLPIPFFHLGFSIFYQSQSLQDCIFCCREQQSNLCFQQIPASFLSQFTFAFSCKKEHDTEQGEEWPRDPTEKQQEHSKCCMLYVAYTVISWGWLFSFKRINYIYKSYSKGILLNLARLQISCTVICFDFSGFDIVPTFLPYKEFNIRLQKWCTEALPVSCGEQTRASIQKATVFRPWKSWNNRSSTDLRRSSRSNICSLLNFLLASLWLIRWASTQH